MAFSVLVFSGTDLTGPHCFYFLHSRFSSSLLKPPTTHFHFLSSVKPLQWNGPGSSPRRTFLCISAEKCEDLFFIKLLSPLRHNQKLISKLLIAPLCECIHSRNGQRENHIRLNINNNFFFFFFFSKYCIVTPVNEVFYSVYSFIFFCNSFILSLFFLVLFHFSCIPALSFFYVSQMHI